MATKDDLLEKLENEIHLFAVPPSEAADDFYLKRIGAMTAIKGELGNLPLTDEQVEMLMSFDNPLFGIEAVWTDPLRDIGEKSVSEAVAVYLIEAVSQYRRTLLYGKMKAEYDKYLAEVIEYLAKTNEISPIRLVNEAHEMAQKQSILLILEDDTAIDDRMVEILLSTEYPLDGIYQEWLDNDLSTKDMLLETMDGFVYQREKDLLCDYQNGEELPEYLMKRFDDMAQGDFNGDLTEDLEP